HLPGRPSAQQARLPRPRLAPAFGFQQCICNPFGLPGIHARPSEGGGRVGTDDHRLALANVAEAVRDAALEIVGLAGPEHAHLAADGNLNLAGDDDAALLALVDDHGLAGIAARLHHLAQDAHLPLRAMLADSV